MRKIKEVLRLKYELGKSQREIKHICGIGKTTVQEYINRATAAGLIWPLPPEMTEEELEKRLFPVETVRQETKPPIGFGYLYEELKRPNVTLALLWAEYKQNHPDGYQKSRFYQLYHKYAKTMNYSMRQEHKAGEKLFVDFGSVEEPKVLDTSTGEYQKVHFFAAVWGASQFAYAEASLSQDVPSWIKLNTNALKYFNCAPKAIVPDNLKSAVTKACRYEPIINNTFIEFSEHYGLTILPARPYKPKDKALVENGVKLIKRWILARLRNRLFHSVTELNAAIHELLELFNTKVMKRYGKSRKELFEALDKPAAISLPDVHYEYSEWKKVRVGVNYHVSFEKHDYSVPHTLIHEELDLKASSSLIEVYFKGERVCSHVRSRKANACTTIKEHMPLPHQKYLEWPPERIMSWAGKYGPAVKELVEKVLASTRFPEQSYKRCLGIIRLANHYPSERVNAACGIALKINSLSYRSVVDILKNNMDKKADFIEQKTSRAPIIHSNIRGKQYFSDCLFPNNNTPEDKQ
jgi:transposase